MEAELLAAIYAAPDDDAPRLVYADWLQERGDSLGEFVALQLRGVVNKRADTLQREHSPRIFGTLANQIRWGKLARGFPWSCALKPNADPRDPRWATVSHVHGGELLDDAVPMPCLRHLELYDHDLDKLGRLARPIAAETIAWHMDDLGYRVTASLGKLTIAPKLRRLEIHDQRRALPKFERYWHHPADLAWLQLAVPELSIRVDLGALPLWIARFAATAVQHLELVEPREDGWRLVLTRDATGELSQLEIRVPRAPPDPRSNTRFGDAVLAGLGTLGKQQLTRATIVGTGEIVEQLQQRIAAQVRIA